MLLKALLALLQVFYALIVLLVVPMAFDQGEDCGVAFAFTLIAYFACVVTLRTIFRDTKLSFVGNVLYMGQAAFIPSLLVFHVAVVCQHEISWLRPLKLLMHNATGLFFILEGFCSVITIQALGKLWKYLGRRSESLMLAQITFASVNIAIVMFFLVRIYTIPTALDPVSATLIGSALTFTAALGITGIVTKKGSAMESSLLFAYVVYLIYVTFTDFQSLDAGKTLFPFYATSDQTPVEPSQPVVRQSITALMARFRQHETPTPLFQTNDLVTALPPIILDGYYSLISSLARVTPSALVAIYNFVIGAVSAITPSVLLTFVVRVGVFMLAMRIIPSIRHPRGERISLREHPLLFLVYSYSPCLIIAVYTHLLMQHFGGVVHLPKDTPDTPFWMLLFSPSQVWLNSRQSWQLWGWANIFSTLFIYGVELALSGDY